MDLVIKKYFDQYRADLPPELKGKVAGCLMPDMALLEKWRNWRTGLDYKDTKLDAILFGALDDCLVDEGRYIPLDYKTKGSAPNDADSEKYYQTQLDTYSFLLNENGYKTADFAYLVYYYPEEVTKNGVVHFKVDPIKISTSHARLKKLFEDAVKLLKGPMPEKHGKCEYCCWVGDRFECED